MTGPRSGGGRELSKGTGHHLGEVMRCELDLSVTSPAVDTEQAVC